MGWFWADSTPTTPRAPHPIPRSSDASPPPSCPMHKKMEGASPALRDYKEQHQKRLLARRQEQGQIAQPNLSLSDSDSSSACPYKPSSRPTASKLNPLNWMPTLPNARESSSQTAVLPTEREPSTIPKGDGSGTWEYPSPQQMYNALLRKGYDDTPADAVESMVAVHNFLNEGAWAEILEWEASFSEGLGEGWRRCSSGPSYLLQCRMRAAAQARAQAARGEGSDEVNEPQLIRFMGRPGDLTPKARILQFAGWLWPSRYSAEPPFDRHDWYVKRHFSDGTTKEVRYVIDYYSGPPEPTGEPVFFLDVRPAVDGPTAACERLMKWGGDVWYRGSGGSVREERSREKAKEKEER